uniref:Uncharacterized protein n=1 Tax=Amphilophus citrinellus TaxID=61819 RepID=A0A3Q0TD13_AMPCI
WCFPQYCVLSPVKWSDLRKSKSMDPDLRHLHRSPGGGGGCQPEMLSEARCGPSRGLRFPDRRGREQPAPHLGLSGSRRLSAASHVFDGRGLSQ